jgi:D-alanyl-D-alanine carboxypeptidase
MTKLCGAHYSSAAPTTTRGSNVAIQDLTPLLLVALLAIAPAALQGQQPSGPAPAALAAELAAIDVQLAADFAADGIAALSIGVVSGDRLIWSKHYGYAEMETKRAPTNDTAYRIGSITKQFTALALLQLVEQGKVRLTDPLEKYVPEIRDAQDVPSGSPPITLLQVASMHSGLSREPRDCPDHTVGPVSLWQQRVLECLPLVRYQHEPGTRYLYSNIGYAALGLAIERAAGTPFITVVEEQILEPLGMTRSAMDVTPDIRRDLAHGYRSTRGKPPATREAADRELAGRGYRVPNGALFSTVTDLAKFVAWELGAGPESVLKKETQDANYSRAFFSNAAMTSGYGVGFMVTRRGDVVWIGHGGSTAGYHASALAHRPTRLGVVVFRNCDNCAVDAGPVAVRTLQRLVAAMKPESVRE